MTKRYFITDPLQAMIADKYHGFRFVDEDGNKISLNIGNVFVCWENKDGEAIPLDGLHYIHPDSEHLLQPQEGDLIDGDEGCAVIINDNQTKTIGNQVRLSDAKYLIKWGECKIIQRNNQPFPQFESEDI